MAKVAAHQTKPSGPPSCTPHSGPPHASSHFAIHHVCKHRLQTNVIARVSFHCFCAPFCLNWYLLAESCIQIIQTLELIFCGPQNAQPSSPQGFGWGPGARDRELRLGDSTIILRQKPQQSQGQVLATIWHGSCVYVVRTHPKKTIKRRTKLRKIGIKGKGKGKRGQASKEPVVSSRPFKRFLVTNLITPP